MNLFVGHAGMEPLIYGVVIILGIAILIVKFLIGAWQSFFWDIAIFIAVFSMHGGTMKGGMAAAVAALIGGILIPPLIAVIRFVRR